MTHENTAGVIRNGNLVPAPLHVTNFKAEGIERFRERRLIKQHRNIVLHENAGSIDRATLSRWLKRKGYGYHFVIDPYGLVTQHADVMRRLWHGGRLNPYSVGICVLNPYYPRLVNTPEELELYDLIPAPWWAHCSPKTDRRYARPTERQVYALGALVAYLCRLLCIPTRFPTRALGRHQRKIKGYRNPETRPGPGIVAHRDYSSHADGRYLLERLIDGRYLFERLIEIG